MQALEKVRVKYVDQFLQADLHFFVSMTLPFHIVGPYLWIIFGVFPIPHQWKIEAL